MSRLPHTPPAWVAGYVGIEFADRGRERRLGLDCWGLARLVYAERFGVMLPSLADEYVSATSPEEADGVAARQLEAGDWAQVEDPALGDLVLFRVGQLRSHLGVVISRGRMLHAWKGTDSCVEWYSSKSWGPRLVGFYRYAGPVRVVGRVRPLDARLCDLAVPEGLTLAEILTAATVAPGPDVRVWVGDQEVPPDAWSVVRPRPGRQVTVSCAPAGGKSPLRIVLTIAVIVAVIYAPYLAVSLGGNPAVWGAGTIGGSLLAAGVGLTGTLLINAIAPPPRPRLSGGDLGQISPSVSGGGNSANRYGPVPVVFGEHRISPPYGAAPYSEIAGDAQYLRMLFICGTGPVEIDDIRIGATPIEEFEGVEVEVRNGYAGEDPVWLYPGTVLEQALSVLLGEVDGWVVRTSDTQANELSIDCTFPRGLAKYNSDGSKSEASVIFEVEYSPVGAGAWQRVNAESPSFFRGLDMLFRTPNTVSGGSGLHTGRVAWSGDSSFPDAKPDYLPDDSDFPADGYSWEVTGSVYCPTTGSYEFGLDGSDACDLHVDWRGVATFYGGHAPQGSGGTPDYTGHTGTLSLTAGWHTIRARVESRNGNPSGGALAIAWKQPGDPGLSIIPAASFRALDGTAGSLTYAWFDTSGYDSLVETTASRSDQIRQTIAWAVPEGQYDIRVRRTTPDSADERLIDELWWTSLRTFRAEDPVRLDGIAKIAIRIKATDQLNGIVDELNCICRSILPDYEPGQFGAWILRATSNPASIYRAILQGPANHRPIADARLDLDELAAWHDGCRQGGLEFNGVFDFEGTVWERLSDVAAAGRASPGMRDGLYSVVRDRVQSVPVQHFTPRNSSSYRGRRAFPDLPHGLRIRFLNAEQDYQQDERIVLADGYQLDGLDAFGNDGSGLPLATIFEVVELFGVTDPGLAWRHGRYHLATARLRPEMHELTTDIEHLVCNRGDLILASHDVTLWGQTSGRVTGLVTDTADNLTGVVIDEPVVMDAGKDYVLRARLADGSSFLMGVVTEVGRTDRIAFTGPVSPTDPRPARGDLWMFGELGQETRELLVKAIDIDEQLNATLTLIDHAPAVHQADQGEIPPWDSGVSDPPKYRDRPDPPVIEDIRSDETVMVRDTDGSWRLRMVIFLRPPSGFRPFPTHAQVRLREKPVGGSDAVGSWTSLPLVAIDANQVPVLDVVEGLTYEIRLRVVTADGKASEWVAAEHTVVGKTWPPPDVESFEVYRLSDGTRRYVWDLGDAPPDIAGVRIRYGPTWADWQQLTALHTGELQASPTDLNEPPAGTWRFGIVAVDTSGLESANPLYFEATLGPQRLEGVAFSEDARILGWPGTKTDCHVASPGTVLEADGDETWATLAAFGAATWNAWNRWVLAPSSPIVYTHTMDAGLILDFSPDAIATADGGLVLEAAWSTNDLAYTDFVEISTVRDRTVRGRYLRIRVTVSADTTSPIPVLRSLLVLMRAETKEHEIQDLDTSGLDASRVFAAGDIRLPVPDGRFSLIRSVSLTFNGMGPGWSWEIVDRSAALGPRVRLYNAQDEGEHATIDAVIRGL